MKAYYGDGATKENDWGFNWLPRVTGDHSHFGYWLDMADGKMDGLFVMGQNPAVGAANRASRAHRSLQTEVAGGARHGRNRNGFFLARFSRSTARRTFVRKTIGTEVFLLPAAGTAEKAGTFTNTQRLLQYREKAVEPPGDARSETWFMYHLGVRLKAKAKNDPRPRNAGLKRSLGTTPIEGPSAEPCVEEVLRKSTDIPWPTANS